MFVSVDVQILRWTILVVIFFNKRHSIPDEIVSVFRENNADKKRYLYLKDKPA